MELKGFQIDKRTLQQLAALERLDQLVITNCTFARDADVQLLGSTGGLHTILFFGGALSDPVLRSFASLPELESVALVKTRHSAAALAALFQSRDDIVVTVHP